MKILGALLLLAATTTLGAWSASRLYRRERKLRQMYKFIDSLCEEIRLTRAELPDALERTGGSKMLSDGVWTDTYGLNVGDIRVLDSFLSALGKTDIEGQINNARLHKSALLERINEATEEKKKFSKLYLSLGFLCGMFAVVLII
ncbi:MAG: stage III sporulation protein AB [Clostridia bacterium]|nr:stage III sporulation protein AB [Clostridia bacterium]